MDKKILRLTLVIAVSLFWELHLQGVVMKKILRRLIN